MSYCTVIGVGGAGLSLARYASARLGGRLIAINTDRKVLEDLPPEQGLMIGLESCSGMGATSPARGRRAAEESLDEIKARLPESGSVVLMAGLGGGAGTGAVPVIAYELLQRSCRLCIAVTLPLRLEAERRKPALAALESLQATAASVLIHDLAEHANSATSLNEALTQSGSDLTQCAHTWLKDSPYAC